MRRGVLRPAAFVAAVVITVFVIAGPASGTNASAGEENESGDTAAPASPTETAEDTSAASPETSTPAEDTVDAATSTPTTATSEDETASAAGAASESPADKGAGTGGTESAPEAETADDDVGADPNQTAPDAASAAADPATTAADAGHDPEPEHDGDDLVGATSSASDPDPPETAETSTVAPAAVTITVDSDGDGAGASGCTLRRAIENASNGAQTHPECAPGSSSEPNIVEVALASALVTLTSGQLVYGNATQPLTINGNEISVTTSTVDRLLQITSAVALTLSRVHFFGGSATFGGAVQSPLGNVTATDSSFTSNSATQSGGAGGNGGAIAAQNVSITRSILTGNTAEGVGGAVVAEGDVTITDSDISANSSGLAAGGGSGGGIVALGSTTVTGSTFSMNSANDGDGGAINSSGPELMIVNSTFEDNAATDSGGTAGFGGAVIAHPTTSATIVYSTFVSNSAEGGGAQIFISDVNGTPSVTSFGTIYADPQGGAGITNCEFGPSLTPTGSNSLDTDGSCGTTSPITAGADLGPIDNYGGPTQTLLPNATSPVINAIPVARCNPDDTDAALPSVTDDQRDVNRPQGDGCDIGSVEARAALTVTKQGPTGPVSAGDPVRFTIEVANVGDYTLTDVVVTDPATSDCSRTISSIAAGDTAKFDCIHPNATESFTNTASVAATSPAVITAVGGVTGVSNAVDVTVTGGGGTGGGGDTDAALSAAEHRALPSSASAAAAAASLPFTGGAAVIPLIVVGALTLAAGALLSMHRSRS